MKLGKKLLKNFIGLLMLRKKNRVYFILVRMRLDFAKISDKILRQTILIILYRHFFETIIQRQGNVLPQRVTGIANRTASE